MINDYGRITAMPSKRNSIPNLKGGAFAAPVREANKAKKEIIGTMSRVQRKVKGLTSKPGMKKYFK